MVVSMSKMGITSCVITGGCLIAWAIVTGVSAGGSANERRRRREKYDLISSIKGDKAAAKAEIKDATNDGVLTEGLGLALEEAVDSSKVSAPTVGGALTFKPIKRTELAKLPTLNIQQ